MVTRVTTIAGETVDLICRRHYGDESGYAEAVYETNRGLAAHGPFLPVGLSILLPDMARPVAASPVVRLWD